MSYFIDNSGLHDAAGGTLINGGSPRTPDTRGTPSIIYGDTGPEKVNTNLFKVKLGYDINSELQNHLYRGIPRIVHVTVITCKIF